MAFYLSPLVDVTETDITTTIPAVATSIGCIVLRSTWKGPELKRQLVTSLEELLSYFGEPTTDSYKDVLAAIGYLKYGNKLYCTRVMPTDATFSGLYGNAASGTSFSSFGTSAYTLASFDSEDPDQFAEDVNWDLTPGAEFQFISSSRGVWGNYIKLAVIDKEAYDKVKNLGDETGSATNTTLLSDALFEDILDIDYPIETDREFIVIVKAADQGDTTASTVTYSIKEVWYVSTDANKVDDQGKNIYCENLINQESKWIRMALATGQKNSDITVCTYDYITMANGSDGTSVADADIIEAYDLYEDPDTIDVNIFIDADKSLTVKQELVDICESRKDCMTILDCRQTDVVNNTGSEVGDLRDYRNVTLNENTSYAAIYGNWLEVFDTWAGKYRWIPASGHVAGIFANTDDVSDPWFAPAGLNRALLTNVRKLAWNPTLGQRDILYKNGINPITSFSGQGKVIWGQKTLLDKSSAFNRINVRRLFIVLEKAISTAAKYFIFEPNDEYTRSQMVNMIEPFLRDVKGRRGIYDYLVVCDERNNTDERIDRNELWVDIYLKPTRAAEFIVLNFVATKTGASFSEILTGTSTIEI